MKVGLFFHNTAPEFGGGHTFEQEILASIIEFTQLSHHNFVVFSFGVNLSDKLSSFKNIEFISIDRTNWRNFPAIIRGVTKTIVSRLTRPHVRSSSTFIIEAISDINYQILKKYQFDFIWSVTHKSITVNIPYAITIWDLQHRIQPYFPEFSEGKNWDYRESLYSTDIRRASFIITGTNVGKAEIQKFYQVSSERVKILPFPTPKFATNNKIIDRVSIFKKYDLPQIYLFYPAQFWSHKNHANLLLAIKIIKEKYKLDIAVVFTGSERENLTYIKQMVVDLHLTDQVKFLGFVPQTDLIQLYLNAFALIFVSFFGPDNLPPLEAFALGCPVIAANVSGAKEQLGESALLVDPKNVEEIAAAIHLLSADPDLRQKLIQSGLTRSNQWTREDYVKGMFKIMDEFENIQRCWPRKY